MAKKVTGEQYYDLDGQLAEIKRQMRQPNGYPFDPHLLKNALQNVIEGKFGMAQELSVDIITVNYNLGFEEWESGDSLSRRFPIKGKDTAQFERCYFYFGHEIMSDKAKRIVEEAGWKVAQAEHLLASERQLPRDRYDSPIAALGAVSKSGEVLCFAKKDHHRRPVICSKYDIWSRHCYFLAVRKVSEYQNHMVLQKEGAE